MPIAEITEHVAQTGAHRTFYLASGPENGPLIIFVHGWPELSLSWRHQLPALAALGFRCIAPDMRGYGRSSIYREIDDYAQEMIVGDMIALLDYLQRDRAVWVGHDWGSPVVWNIASHHPDRCAGVANLCVPYSGPDTSAFELIDRAIYPEDEYPVGQWDYMLYYHESFDKATAEFDANVRTALKGLFRKGDPAGVGKPAATAIIRKAGGFFGDLGDAVGPLSGLAKAKNMPIDEDVISAEDLQIYTEALQRNGFFGPSAWYVNTEPNAEYAAASLDGGKLSMPVLFIGAMYDYTCETITSRAKEPMQKLCNDLTLEVIKSGHWMAQEKPVEVNSVLVRWLATKVSDIWPQPG
jgi:pimeloyl-ACP methyl ester carboxylesterase